MAALNRYGLKGFRSIVNDPKAPDSTFEAYLNEQILTLVNQI